MTHLTRRISAALTAAAAAVAVVALTTLPAEAQTITDPAASMAEGVEVTILPSAGELATMADDLASEAARLSDEDPERAEALRLAGRYYHHAGQLEKSRKTLIEAGLAFHRVGEHRLSSHAFLDASEVAVEAGDTPAALEAADMAGAVLRSGDLSAKEREEILSRVSYVERDVSPQRWPGRPDA